MKYTPKQYAQALLLSLEETSVRKHSYIIKNFIKLLVRNNDMSLWRRVTEEFERLYNKKYGIQKVHISVPVAGDVRILSRAFSPRGKRKRFDISTTVDPLLRGGATVRIGDVLIDTSVQSRFRQLRSALV